MLRESIWHEISGRVEKSPSLAPQCLSSLAGNENFIVRL
jgi:hypothetical protein